ncbi:hypothetical protein FB45DRAFT_936264 [Roridomyces roridus]|uniref:SAM domain-containing protein n=1 Tax=Roridomyces roridus TaxID=1738132 RepID=A0AAD7B9P7_9AGAR|nr:hypothetical protein FB45DRAFT_936264 [Roridomyces roridus]
MLSLKINGTLSSFRRDHRLMAVVGGRGGPGGASPRIGGNGGRGGGPRPNATLVKVTQSLELTGGIGGAGGEGGNMGGQGGHGETADMAEPLLPEDEVYSLPDMDLKKFCTEHGIEKAIYQKLRAEGYNKLSSVANASPQELKDDCGLKGGHINELKTAMKVLLKKLAKKNEAK